MQLQRLPKNQLNNIGVAKLNPHFTIMWYIRMFVVQVACATISSLLSLNMIYRSIHVYVYLYYAIKARNAITYTNTLNDMTLCEN